MPNRRNAGNLMASRTKAKTAAAPSVSATTKAGSAVMAMPATESVEAIATSATEDATSQALGRELQR